MGAPVDESATFRTTNFMQRFFDQRLVTWHKDIQQGTETEQDQYRDINVTVETGGPEDPVTGE